MVEVSDLGRVTYVMCDWYGKKNVTIDSLGLEHSSIEKFLLDLTDQLLDSNANFEKYLLNVHTIGLKRDIDKDMITVTYMGDCRSLYVTAVDFRSLYDYLIASVHIV